MLLVFTVRITSIEILRWDFQKCSMYHTCARRLNTCRKFEEILYSTTGTVHLFAPSFCPKAPTFTVMIENISIVSQWKRTRGQQKIWNIVNVWRPMDYLQYIKIHLIGVRKLPDNSRIFLFKKKCASIFFKKILAHTKPCWGEWCIRLLALYDSCARPVRSGLKSALSGRYASVISVWLVTRLV